MRGSVDNVPFSYVEKVRDQWWKYVIPYNFNGYKPIEIDEWPAEVILEHLAAIREIKRQTKGGEKY